MKTIIDCQNEISEITSDLLENRKLPIDQQYSSTKDNKLNNRILFLRTIVKYLEFDPKEDFCNKERDRLYNAIAVLDKGFAEWLKTLKVNITKTQAVSKFNTEMGITNMKKQIQALNYILS